MSASIFTCPNCGHDHYQSFKRCSVCDAPMNHLTATFQERDDRAGCEYYAVICDHPFVVDVTIPLRREPDTYFVDHMVADAGWYSLTVPVFDLKESVINCAHECLELRGGQHV